MKTVFLLQYIKIRLVENCTRRQLSWWLVVLDLSDPAPKQENQCEDAQCTPQHNEKLTEASRLF